MKTRNRKEAALKMRITRTITVLNKYNKIGSLGKVIYFSNKLQSLCNLLIIEQSIFSEEKHF